MGNNILLIDDEKDFSDLTSTLLDFHDLHVTTFNDPLDLLNKLTDKKHDIIVTDLMMPHMDGFQLIDKIREFEQYKKTPIIILTAKTLNDEERKYILQNHLHLMIKPFQPQDLVDLIKKLLEPTTA